MDIALSHQAFHELWKHFGPGSKPLALNVQPQGVLLDERRAAEARAWEELREIGIDDRDRSDDLRGALLPLHQYHHAFDLTYRHRDGGQDRRRSGLVAVEQCGATLAVRDAERVRITARRPDGMIRALLDVLPELTAGPGKGVSLRSADLDQVAAEAGTSNRAMQEGLVRRGVRREDVRALVGMAGQRRVAFAQFGASVVDGVGRRRRAATVTSCFATAQGWYLMEESTRGSQPWTTFAPVDKPRMESRIQDLLKTVPRDCPGTVSAGSPLAANPGPGPPYWPWTATSG